MDMAKKAFGRRAQVPVVHAAPTAQEVGSPWYQSKVRKLGMFFGTVRQCRECWHPHINGAACGNCGNHPPEIINEPATVKGY